VAPFGVCANCARARRDNRRRRFTPHLGPIFAISLLLLQQQQLASCRRWGRCRWSSSSPASASVLVFPLLACALLERNAFAADGTMD
jgi:hypothetical protein